MKTLFISLKKIKDFSFNISKHLFFQACILVITDKFCPGQHRAQNCHLMPWSTGTEIFDYNQEKEKT